MCDLPAICIFNTPSNGFLNNICGIVHQNCRCFNITIQIRFYNSLIILEVHRLTNQQINVTINPGALIPPALCLLAINTNCD